MADALLMILFLALVAGAAEFVRARCRRELLASTATARTTGSTDAGTREPVG